MFLRFKVASPQVIYGFTTHPDLNPLKDRLGAYRRLPLYLDWITCKNGYFNPKNMILGSGRVDLGTKHVFFLKKNAKHAILAHLEG